MLEEGIGDHALTILEAAFYAEWSSPVWYGNLLTSPIRIPLPDRPTVAHQPQLMNAWSCSRAELSFGHPPRARISLIDVSLSIAFFWRDSARRS